MVLFFRSLIHYDTFTICHTHDVLRSAPLSDECNMADKALILRCQLEVIWGIFLLQRLRIRPHNQGGCQVVERAFPCRDARPTPLGCIKAEEEDGVSYEVDEPEEPAAFCQHMVAHQRNSVSAYMFRANMARVAFVLFWTALLGELAISVAM